MKNIQKYLYLGQDVSGILAEGIFYFKDTQTASYGRFKEQIIRNNEQVHNISV